MSIIHHPEPGRSSAHTEHPARAVAPSVYDAA